MQREIPVLILGGGIVGLTASLALAQQGIRTIVVEKHISTAIHGRARGWHYRTMEIFRSLGVGERVKNAGGSRARPGFLSGKSLASVIADQKNVQNSGGPNLGPTSSPTQGPIPAPQGPPGFQFKLPSTDKYSPENFTFCPQDRIEPIIASEAIKSGNADIRFGTELVSFEQDDDGVLATVNDRKTGNISSIRAKYIIAADGARGRTREQLGIQMSGEGVYAHFLNINFEADISSIMKGQEVSLCTINNEMVQGLFVAGENNLWIFHLLYHPEKGESPKDFSNERCVELLRSALGVSLMDVIIKQTIPWEAGIRVAEQYQKGRVFLAGDAAHLMPPFGGFGATTGIADAHNLAWKLALVLRGEADPELLATYTPERRPVAQRLCEVSETQTKRALALFSSEESGAATKKVDPNIGLLALELVAVRYDSKAIKKRTELHTPPVDLNFECSVIPGMRLPHLEITRGDSQISTLDLVKKDFVLILKKNLDRDAWVQATKNIELNIDVVQFGVDAIPIDEEIAAKRFNCAGVLVRPDSHVAWTFLDSEDPSNLVEIIHDILRSGEEGRNPRY